MSEAHHPGGAHRAGRAILVAFLLIVCGVATKGADQAVYADALQNGWQNWGWATLNYNATSPVHGGSFSISVSSSNWQALYFHHTVQNGSQYSAVRFWINGGATGGQIIQVQATRNQAPQVPAVLTPLPANSWRQETVSLSALGVDTATDWDGFWLQVQDVGVAPTFFVDDITIVTNGVPPATVTLTSPLQGANYIAPATVPLAASVTANGRTIDRVQFLNGLSVLGEDLSAPYTFSWSNVTVGSYSLKARVLFDQGSASAGSNDSATVGITVVTNSVASITVDAQKNRRAINPNIYGVAFASAAQVADLNAPLNRSGGNSETRYNWLINAHNHANDWYFESLADSPATPGAAADSFISDTRSAGAEPLITVSMLGWMPKLGPGRARLASYAITNYGLQSDHDWQYFSQAGNGIITNTSILITTNNPNDANFPTNSNFQRAWVQHLTNAWGTATNGGVRYYIMDNEHTLWHSTHRDVHPIGTTMVEIRDNFFDYAGMVKALDPNALVLAPEEWGWPGYLYSGYDWQWAGAHGYPNQSMYPDRGTNGGWDYGPWLLDQFRQRATNTNQRLLDVFTYHIYPQGANESGNDVGTTTQLGRNRSTRALWDTNYVDNSWINNIIKLIPRMRGWVNTYYPGTQIGITEYNWGAEGHINGATAQADIYGIFGREGLDLATRWTTPAANSPTYKAMKMYRNYDGAKSTFGDTSVSASGPNPDTVAVFGAQRSQTGALTLMVINKQLAAAAVTTINLTNFLPSGTAQVWQLNAANTINHLSDLSFTGNSFSNQLPAQSITLFILPPGGPPALRALGVSDTNTFVFRLDGIAGQRYAIQGTTNFVNWTSLQTNTLVSSNLVLSLATSPLPYRFYRAQWVP